jgi:hypothetical protein
MAWWIYLGKVTTPIDIPGRGPVVLVPRLKFEAPMSSVAHLVRLKYVAPLKPFQIPKEAAPKPAPVAVPEPAPAPVVQKKEDPVAAPAGPSKSKEEPKEPPSDENAPVVASTPAEGEQSVPEDAENTAGEEKEKVLLEEAKKGGKTSRKRRRG